MNTNVPNVYVLYTGGTIGMSGHPLKPMSAKKFRRQLANMPGFTETSVTVQTLEDQNYSINYTMDAFDTPIDSSSMTPQDWVTIAQRVLSNYTKYDGFVVLPRLEEVKRDACHEDQDNDTLDHHPRTKDPFRKRCQWQCQECHRLYHDPGAETAPIPPHPPGKCEP